MRKTWLGIVLSFGVGTASAGVQLGLPIDCEIGVDCFVQQYVDHDPGPEARDFACGRLTYDGHKGTDIRVITDHRMQEGVDVIASAPGRVRATRNDMVDRRASPETRAALSGRECGNGLVLVHDDGWETQYCHMKMGSVAVKPGDHVERGQFLGQVGLSGLTQFPHVHLSVRKDGKVVDPFAPEGASSCGAPVSPQGTLWLAPIAYNSSAIMEIGFATEVPEYRAIQAGTVGLERLQSSDPALVVWAFAFGKRPGDLMILSIDGPSDVGSQRTELLDRWQASYFYAYGIRRPKDGWPAGTYSATVVLVRDGIEIDRKSAKIPGG